MFAAASLLVIAYAVHSGTPLRYSDEKEYVEIARGIVAGDGYRLYGADSAYRPPAWPLLLAAFLAVGVPESLLPAVSAALLVIAAVSAGVLGVRITRCALGAIAAPFVLLYPINAYTATTLYPQALATAALVLLVLYASRAGDGHLSTRSALAIGALLAVSVLSVPTMGFSAAVIGLWILVRQHGNRFRYAVAAGLTAFAPIAAWTVYNAHRLGSPVVVSTSGGRNLLIGNNPSATGSSGVAVDLGPYEAGARGLNEVDQDRYMQQSAIDWITANPGRAASLYVEKTLNYFAPYNPPATAEQAESPARIALLVLAFAVMLVGVALRLGLHRRLSIRPVEWLIMGLFVANAPVMAVFFTRTRFRQPLDALLLIETAVAVAVVVPLLLARRRSARTATPTPIPE
ncbi:hypothetical protein [Tsukamurella columbiensis]|uniref:Glycosyltransferase RgtA/B/C/D-like domain-containing protein n=4 Tax=Tsukamurella TaxID=2060 RepID=A0A5C5RY48_9ACTN|nr:hypothetical protein [Tsukamurella columbiensis]NMD57055.1 hypothetical protein [Tsukamurella columbiensis]TWS27714.1 hypothetical protein FK530_17455 [Tsukamurella conjunctivitidis]